MSEERWTTSDDEGCWSTSDEFPTRDEAIAFGRDVGLDSAHPEAPLMLLASGVGKSVADDLLERLARRCQEVVDWYLAQDPPTFWELECVEEIPAADEEGDE